MCELKEQRKKKNEQKGNMPTEQTGMILLFALNDSFFPLFRAHTQITYTEMSEHIHRNQKSGQKQIGPVMK